MNSFQLTPVEADAIRLSLKVAAWAVLINLPVGVLTARLLSGTRFPGKSVLDGIVHLPLVLPPVVIGYLLLTLLGRNGIIGGFFYDHFGLTIAFTWKGAAVASGVMAFPLLVRAVRISMEAIDKGLEQAARTLGAGPVKIFFTITLPLATPGIITGIMLAFARSLGEFGATITFVSNIRGETQTLPLALYSLTQMPGGESSALRLCVISILIAIIALVGSDWLSRRFSALIIR